MDELFEWLDLGKVRGEPGDGVLRVLAEVVESILVEGEELLGEIGILGAPCGAAFAEGCGVPESLSVEEDGL